MGPRSAAGHSDARRLRATPSISGECTSSQCRFSGRHISEATPILDSRLPDGSRVAAVIPPCSLSGVTLTIRKFNVRHFEIADLIAGGTLTHGLANRFEDYILQRRNLLICGGTGTGKTTLPRWLRWESWEQLLQSSYTLHQNVAVRIQNVANWPLTDRLS